MITFLKVPYDDKTKQTAIKQFAFPLIVFLAITLFLTFSVILLPTIVIGDNFRWTSNNIIDILGPKIVRSSYMGDIGVLSTFKSGFLFPLTYLFVSLNIPSTIVYPFLFYFLAMVSFYLFSKEFLKSETLRILFSVLYLVNPITPYYYASIINAFSLVLLPLALKFFVRSLREMRSQNTPRLIKNLGFTALFLALTVSANEQFILSVALVTIFLALTFIIDTFMKYRLTKKFLKFSILNFSIFALIFLIVLLPLFISQYNIQSSPLATYFQGPSSSRFIQTISYTYQNSNLNNLLRLGGDAGAGLGVNAWYDSSIITNYFGYILLAFFVLSLLTFLLPKNKLQKDRLFFYQSILLFVAALVLILLMENLSVGLLNNSILSLVLKTWETPMKLRVVLLISVLTTVVGFFGIINFSALKGKKKFIFGLALTFLIAGTVVYNSPWLVNYAGQTTLQEVSDSVNWGGLYNQTFVNMTNQVDQQSQNQRGIILPYTHKAELYSDPNSRIFQLVSSLNGPSSELISDGNFSWSKALGLLSIKSLAVMNDYNATYDGLIFPTTYNLNNALQHVRNDRALTLVNQSQDYNLYDNPNALPLLYASNNYVFYDDVGTLNYAFDYLNFTDLPVFISQQNLISQFNVPFSSDQGIYSVHALCLPTASGNLTLNITNGPKSRIVPLTQKGFEPLNALNDYSAVTSLSPGDIVKAVETETPQTSQFKDVTLNSSALSLGKYGSFSLNFNVNVLTNGAMSFLSPRVLIDTGNEVYYIILHDNGNVELAVQQNGVFYSDVMSQYVGYSLRDPSDSINVKVTRLIDQVDVYLNDNLYLTFPITSNLSNVSLVSEQSVSRFSQINLTESVPIRLFAVRQDFSPISYKVLEISPEESSLVISTNVTNFAVVSQYLYNNLMDAQTFLSANSLQANVFFKAWILKSPQTLIGQKISIGIQDRELSYGSIILSIVFTYSMLLYILKPAIYTKLVNITKSKIKKGNKK